MAIHSSVLAWRIPWTEGLVGYNPWGCKESDTTKQLTHTVFIKLKQSHTKQIGVKILSTSLSKTFLRKTRLKNTYLKVTKRLDLKFSFKKMINYMM